VWFVSEIANSKPPRHTAYPYLVRACVLRVAAFSAALLFLLPQISKPFPKHLFQVSRFTFQRLHLSPPFSNSRHRKTLTEDEADFDEGPREATHVPQVQQGRRSPLLLRQGPQPYCLVRRQRRTPRHLPRPQRRRLVLRRLKQVSYWFHFQFSFSKLFLTLIVNGAGDSGRLITGSADQTAKLWNVQSGQQLFTFNFDSPARSVDFSVGDKLAVITTDPFMELPSAIHVKRIAKDPSERSIFFPCWSTVCFYRFIEKLV